MRSFAKERASLMLCLTVEAVERSQDSRLWLLCWSLASTETLLNTADRSVSGVGKEVVGGGVRN